MTETKEKCKVDKVIHFGVGSDHIVLECDGLSEIVYVRGYFLFFWSERC